MTGPQRNAETDRLVEDATGFGVTELRTARDLLLRPRVVLDAWMSEGPTGNGRYARPLRYYILLSGVLMLVMFLRDGGARFMDAFPPESIDALALRAGKSREVFINDADSWMGLVLVPITCVFYPAIAAPLLRWWDPARLAPVVAVVMGNGVDSISDVFTLAGLTWQVTRNVLDGRDVALVQTLAPQPVRRGEAPPVRIELV